MGGNASVASLDHLDTIPKRVQFWSESLPDRELFVFYDVVGTRSSYTCRQVLEMAGKFAGRLRLQYGFQKGDIIANTLPNSPERLFTDLGITLAGCICMAGEMLYSDGSDFLDSARNSQLSAVIVCPESQSPTWRILEPYITVDKSSPIAVIKYDKIPAMKSAIVVARDPTRHFLKELQGSTEHIFVESLVQADDVMQVFPTSGSTGYCKLVPKTHTDIIDTWSDVQDRINQQSRHVWKDTIFYNDRSMGWMGGFPFGTYISADTRVLLDVFDTHGSRAGVDVWSIICRERADYAVIMPLDLAHMVQNEVGQGAMEYKLKLLGCGGQPIRKNQFLSYYTMAEEVAVLYGSTEAGFLSFCILKEQDVKDYFCGQLKPGIEVRIVREDGQECRSDEIGTILVRGKSVFKGYLNRLQNTDPKTLTVFTKDGWLNTDDTGYFDVDRNLYVLGRLKDVFTFGDFVVYPGWLESKLVQHEEVAEACIVPVSDPVLYRNICAVVKPVAGCDLSEDKLRAFCEKVFVQEDSTPTPTFYMILDDFPKTSTGKVDRVSLQKLAEKKFGWQ